MRQSLPVVPLSVLLIDDDPAVLAALGRALRAAGYATTTAQTREEAMSKAAGHFAAIVDLDLGNDSGVPLAKSLLSAGRVQGLLFFTGSTHLARLRAASELAPVLRKGDGLDPVLDQLHQLEAAPPSLISTVRATEAPPSAGRVRRRRKTG